MRLPEPSDWHEQKTYESMITYGSGAIKLVLFANGGAIISIMTFLGNNGEKTHALSIALNWFVAGVVIGGVTNVTAYLTQLSLFNERTHGLPWWRRHSTWLKVSIGLILGGIICFLLDLPLE